MATWIVLVAPTEPAIMWALPPIVDVAELVLTVCETVALARFDVPVAAIAGQRLQVFDLLLHAANLDTNIGPVP
jgi:hypothetical protein